MARLGLETDVLDRGVYERSVKRFADAKIALPTFAQLADPTSIPDELTDRLGGIDPDAADPANLFRVHWYNAADGRSRASAPHHVVLPESLTGVPAKIVVAIGRTFPMIGAHKVLAAYGCLAPRIITGQFDPTAHKAVWPSTGNYCRGGVAISRIMQCRGVAVLPEGMSRERFSWLERWVTEPSDIIRTPGSESNVKEIYDKCAELDADPQNIVFNQFCEFGNHLVHLLCTGTALEHLFATMHAENGDLNLRAFVSATGSAGTIAAGDHLKEVFGSQTVALEALECPTLLYNGFGEHNIQGIGDKHVPYIHNVYTTDFVTAVSDRASDRLDVLFNTDVGRRYLATRRSVPGDVVAALGELGLSGIANVVGAIKLAKYRGYGPEDVVMTVATDSAAMYGTERDKAVADAFGGTFDEVAAAETWGEHIAGATTDHLLELSHADRTRVFNLGYFTWVEQQGVSLQEFTARRDQRFWRELRALVPTWDEMIDEFNVRTGALAG